MNVRGDARERFGAIVSQYARLIASAIARVGGRRTELIKEDIVQQVLVALWKQVEREQNIEQPASYIYKAAVRETVRALRREQSRRTEPLGDDGPVHDRAPDAFASLAEGEKAAVIEGCLGALALDRERAVRAHLAGFEVAEIMDMYDWPYQKARNLITRGMAELREALCAKGIHG